MIGGFEAIEPPSQKKGDEAWGMALEFWDFAGRGENIGGIDAIYGDGWALAITFLAAAACTTMCLGLGCGGRKIKF